MIDIELVRVAATGPRRGTVFVNPGGPGVSGIDYIVGGFRLEPDAAHHYDLIGFDPRGTGRSSPLRCSFDRTAGPLPDLAPDDQGERDLLDTSARDLAEACARLDGDLLPYLTTEATARDLELLRRAVDDAYLHYLGFSYGTLIGLLYAQRHPDLVGHLVLDGLIDPTGTLPQLLAGQAEGFEAAFDRLDEACGTRLICPIGGITAAHDALVRAVEEAPAGEVGPTEVTMAALVATYDEGLWPRYADAVTAATEGDHSRVEALSDSYLAGASFASYLAVTCTDSPRPATPEEWDELAADLEQRSSRFGPLLANELRSCAWWPVPGAAPRPPVDGAGTGPVLVIGTTNDPATPLTNAERVAAMLDEGHLVVVDGAGHLAYSKSGCVRAIVDGYLVDDTIPPAGTRCGG
jgi:pimeloyl-ACP methyl ester carboxylesterase